jgi:hypothetical protein
MFAVVREATYDAKKKANGSKQLEEFARIRAQQAGYRGTVTLEAGDGRTLTLALWESKEQQEAASAKLAPEAQRLMGPLWTTPARIVGSGEVTQNDLTKS